MCVTDLINFPCELKCFFFINEFIKFLQFSIRHGGTCYGTQLFPLVHNARLALEI